MRSVAACRIKMAESRGLAAARKRNEENVRIVYRDNESGHVSTATFFAVLALAAWYIAVEKPKTDALGKLHAEYISLRKRMDALELKVPTLNRSKWRLGEFWRYSDLLYAEIGWRELKTGIPSPGKGHCRSPRGCECTTISAKGPVRWTSDKTGRGQEIDG